VSTEIVTHCDFCQRFTRGKDSKWILAVISTQGNLCFLKIFDNRNGKANADCCSVECAKIALERFLDHGDFTETVKAA
jgi:hypothetical protein